MFAEDESDEDEEDEDDSRPASASDMKSSRKDKSLGVLSEKLYFFACCLRPEFLETISRRQGSRDMS